MYKNLIELTAAYFTTEKYASEFEKAREEFFRRSGKVFEDDPYYESRMTALIEWYLFDRTLVDVGVPPIRLYYNIHREKISEEEGKVFSAMMSTTHSLFEVVGHTPELLRAKDLFTDRNVSVESNRILATVAKGDYVGTRLIPLHTCAIFSEGIWIYPRESYKFIEREVAKAKGEKPEMKEELLFQLAYMRIKQDRYKHIPLDQIYTYEPLTKDRRLGERRRTMRLG
jgi:hypothetical protein